MNLKSKTLTMTAQLVLSSFFLFAIPSVAADCDNYGNQVIVFSNYDCTINANYCDGESGPAGSGAGAGAGAGAGGQSGADAGASAGSSTNCDQCAGDNCGGEGPSEECPEPEQTECPGEEGNSTSEPVEDGGISTVLPLTVTAGTDEIVAKIES